MNKKNVIITIFLFWVFYSFGEKNCCDEYSKLKMSSREMDYILSQTKEMEIEEKFLSEDITFACGDIKYNNGKLIFCELGDVIYMPLRPIPLIINGSKRQVLAPCWDLFWQYLKQFNLPVWLVGDIDAKHIGALDKFSNLDGYISKSLSTLSKDPFFEKRCHEKIATTQNNLNCKGIIVYKFLEIEKRACNDVLKFQGVHADFLHVNSLADKILEWKDATYKMFECAGLSAFIPRFRIYSTEYSPELIKDILTTFSGSDVLVIKPIFSSGGRGINFIEKGKLAAFLNLILNEKDKIPDAFSKELTFWKENDPKFFLVSDFVQSNVVYKNNNPYDPTMRVIFILRHSKGKIYTTCVAGCWMLPPKTLNDKCSSLERRHISTFVKNSDVCVDEKTWTNVSGILYNVLPSLYHAILKQCKA